MFKAISKEIKEEILHKIQNSGMKVAEASNNYGVSTKAIYSWLAKESTAVPNVLLVNQLRRQNEKLYAIIGRVTAEMEQLKRGRRCS